MHDEPPRRGTDPALHGWLLAGATLSRVALLIVVAYALWMVWPAFEPGRLVNLDAPRHLLRAEVMTRQFLPSGHVDGWSPWWYLGAQLFLFQSYGYFFLIGLSALAVAPLAGLGAVFKFWYVAPIVVLPLAVARMATRLGVGPAGALVAAVASLTFSSALGYGMKGLFGVGLLLQAAGVVGFALAWPEILDVLLERRRAPWRAAMAVAALVLVHFISGAYALAASGLVAAALAWRVRDPWPLLRYTVVAVLVLMLAGHALFPSLELRALGGSGVGWGTERDRLLRLLAGTLFGARPIALAAIAAAAWSLWRGSPRLAATAMVFFVTAVLGGTDQQPWEPAFVATPLRVYVRPRALPYAALMQAVFAGVAFDAVVGLATRLGRSLGRRALMLPIAALAVLLAVAVPTTLDHRRGIVTEARLHKRDRRVYIDLVAWLKKNVHPPAVVAVPRTLFPRPVLGARSAISLLNLDTGVYTLGGDQAELTRSAGRSERVDLDDVDQGTAQASRLLRRAGVSYVIVSRADLRAHFDRSRDFERVYDDPGVELRGGASRRRRQAPRPIGVSVYAVRGGGQWLHRDGLAVLAMRHQPERIAWDIRVRPSAHGDETVAAINWHPNWAADVDGKPVSTHRSASGRVAFDVPDGAARVTLEFVRSTREKAWNALSAATLALLLGLEIRRRRGRRDPRAGHDPTFPRRPLP